MPITCRNRHCPKGQGAATKQWLAECQADLLPVGYFHVAFTLPAEIAHIAWQNKTILYDLLFRAASETMMTIAADPKHLGAHIGITAVLHTWGSANDASSPYPHDRARRRHLARRAAVDIASGLPPAGASAGRALPPTVSDPVDRVA
jgi:hypothetical protein